MLQIAVTTRVLSASDEAASWTPVDIVAQAVIELCILAGASHSDAAYRRYAAIPGGVYLVQKPKLFH